MDVKNFEAPLYRFWYCGFFRNEYFSTKKVFSGPPRYIRILLLLKTGVFFFATFFQFVFIEAPHQFLPESKSFARI